MINIYCDESCHLQFDNSDIVLMGGLSCPKENVRLISQKIRRLKVAYGLNENFEIKWTKVSNGQLSFYLDLLALFFDTSYLDFRCVIAPKKGLNNEVFHQTYDEWYYKMYYLLLSKMLDPTKQYAVYVDIKDSNGGAKIAKLKRILESFLYSFHATCLKNIQIVRSDEVSLLQLCDLIMGCVGYANRFIESPQSDLELSPAKVEMCRSLEELAQRPLTHTTPLYETKFNIFVWRPAKV